MDEKRWPVSQNEAQLQHDSDDEDEALSLSDLPLIHQWRNGIENNNGNFHSDKGGEDQEFDFCALSMESEMCAADEVFFKGQILPLRHSVSSDKALLQNYDARGSIFRSDSMDHYYSSRSSSISSGTSSSSTSSSATAKYNNPKLPPRIQFHSHPSPSPRLNFPTSRYAAVNHRNSVKNSSIWNVLRLALVTPPPEIAFRDLKARSGNSGSRRSTSSNSSGGGDGNGNKKKLRPRILSGSCRCAADTVETIAPRVVIIKRSANDDGEAAAALHRDDPKLAKKQPAKKHISHHRTFEWLKQLTVEGAVDQVQS